MVPSAMWRVPHASKLHWRQWDQEFVVYHEGSGDTHRLNELAARALQTLCADALSVEALANRLAQDVPVPPDGTPSTTLAELLGQLLELGLIEPAD